MNSIYSFSKGQIPFESFTSFQERMKVKDYVGAYRMIAFSNTEDKEEFLLSLIETLVHDDLYDEIHEISRRFRNEIDKTGFLFNIASEYAKVKNLKRALDLYAELDFNHQRSLAIKVSLIENSKESQVYFIREIITFHTQHRDIHAVIEILKNFDSEVSEEELFQLGLSLILEKRWDDCELIADSLDQKRDEFETHLSFIKGTG